MRRTPGRPEQRGPPVDRSRATIVEDVYDPVAEERVDLAVFAAEGTPTAHEAHVDGSELWVLPGLYDADQHWPVPDFGLRASDAYRALAGGAVHVNTAYSWDRIAPATPSEVAASFEGLCFPQVFPVLSVPDEGSEGFADWVLAHAAELKETWPPVCKLYSADPHFDRNVEAVWEAGLLVIVYCYDDDAVDHMVEKQGGPLHFRHATSAELLHHMKSRPATTAQTSPHFLVELDPTQASALHVLPPVPGDPDRTSLLGVLDEVEMVGTDHNAPVPGNEGPGLDVANTFAPALLTIAEDLPGGLAGLLPKATSGPAEVFGTAGRLLPSQILVDPRPRVPFTPWPGQEARRSPYVGRELVGTVLGAVQDGVGVFL